MPALEAVKDRRNDLARSPKELEPLIKEQIALGDIAGMPFFRKAGGMMLEARPGIKAAGEETFEEYCERVSGKSYKQCQVYMRAYREQVAAIENARKNGKPDASATGKLSNSLNELRGSRTTGRVYREWTESVDKVAETARRQQMKETEDRAADQQLKQALARKLIDIGFKVLAKELHPDKMGGSKDAMSRLNEVRNRLMNVYG